MSTSPEPPRISVVVCRHTRADVLRETLPALFAELQSHADFEVIVVDNASTDDTGAITDRYCAEARVPARRVIERRLGLNHARNAGWAAASGDIVWYLDDDAVVLPGWAHAVRDAFLDLGVAMVGGAITLRWPNGKPRWLPNELSGHYSGLDLGPAPRDMRWPEIPYGANMGMRRSAVEPPGGFRHDLDRQGKNLLSNGDKEFAYRVYQAGCRLRYSHAARVDHIVPMALAHLRWVVRRAYWSGISDVRFSKYRVQHDSLSDVERGRRWLGRNIVVTLAALRRG